MNLMSYAFISTDFALHLLASPCISFASPLPWFPISTFDIRLLCLLASVLTSSPATPRAIGCALIAPVVSLHQMHFQRRETLKKNVQFCGTVNRNKQKKKIKLSSRWLRRRRERSEAVARLSCPAFQCNVRGPRRALCICCMINAL